ncbi:MAG: hypothetical protein D6814_17725 [Calditrichaeota bacterium]|nr:MAG: hypothetical protein D6814_17725 [Calditrichota bacterium]
MTSYKREPDWHRFNLLMLSILVASIAVAPRLVYTQTQDLKNIRLPDSQNPKAALVVGKLIGHDDFRDTYVYLQSGNYPIAELSDSTPFRVLIYSPKYLEISFKNRGLSNPIHPRRIIFRFFKNELGLITAMILEKVDYAVFRTETQAREINRANPNIAIIPMRAPPNNVQMVIYNLRHPLFRHAEVRRAISYAINKKKMVEELLENGGTVARGSPFETDRPFYPRGVDSYNYQPKRAIEILHKAGWRDSDGDGILEKGNLKLKFRLAFEMGVQLEEKIARRIQLDLFDIGVEIIPMSYSKIELKQKYLNDHFDAVLLENRFQESIDSLYQFFASREKGFVKFYNKSFENLYRLSQRPGYARQEVTLARQMQAILNRYCVASFLFYRYYDYHLFNIRKLDNFYDEKKAVLKPFDVWIIK